MEAKGEEERAKGRAWEERGAMGEKGGRD